MSCGFSFEELPEEIINIREFKERVLLYTIKEWTIVDNSITTGDLLQTGNRLFTGNGYIGRRGVPDDSEPSLLPATIISGLYDGDKIREPVNVPDPLFINIVVEGTKLSLDSDSVLIHEQSLDFRYGKYMRSSAWAINDSIVNLQSERFVDRDYIHRMCARHTISSDQNVHITIKIGINGAVHDLNGPHLETFHTVLTETTLNLQCVTVEKQIVLGIACGITFSPHIPFTVEQSPTGIFKVYHYELPAHTAVQCTVYGAVFSVLDPGNPIVNANATVSQAFNAGWDSLFETHCEKWDSIWKTGDVIIEGDDEAQCCLRYSMYQLHCHAPRHSGDNAIPVHGLSGQMHKGAVCWDTELTVFPYFLATEPDMVAKFIRYRIRTLPSAKQKASEYGYQGAFYARESQETGIDACSDFSVVDVWTERPIRTYFRDKQIHINADIVYMIKKYIDWTGEWSILLEGAFEVILECTRFYLSYIYYSPRYKRFEILDVVGPDEYHERVHNNAFTNAMVLFVFNTVKDYADMLRWEEPDFAHSTVERLHFDEDLMFLKTVIPHLYQKMPNAQNIIEQFDGYFHLESCSIDNVRSRLKHPQEYWGAGVGVAVPTQIIKQADTVALLALFPHNYSFSTKKATLEFYEPRTEHNSNLSTTMNALICCDIGELDRAYCYFRENAEFDVKGEPKHRSGTHPAANGGAWMIAIQGFCGFSIEHKQIKITPRLPEAWEKVRFSVRLSEGIYDVTVTKEKYTVVKR
ncbi:MAG: glycoside hydrolase family 65 protein [Treponema sp.]|nr:glycoside hydrolase family 65 protein [Treponema sp.]